MSQNFFQDLYCHGIGFNHVIFFLRFFVPLKNKFCLCKVILGVFLQLKYDLQSGKVILQQLINFFCMIFQGVCYNLMYCLKWVFLLIDDSEVILEGVL